MGGDGGEEDEQGQEELGDEILLSGVAHETVVCGLYGARSNRSTAAHRCARA
jgi:hypothetical protein